jgi:hypothetical protein
LVQGGVSFVYVTLASRAGYPQFLSIILVKVVIHGNLVSERIVIPAKAGIHGERCVEPSLHRHISRTDIDGFRPSPE